MALLKLCPVPHGPLGGGSVATWVANALTGELGGQGRLQSDDWWMQTTCVLDYTTRPKTTLSPEMFYHMARGTKNFQVSNVSIRSISVLMVYLEHFYHFFVPAFRALFRVKRKSFFSIAIFFFGCAIVVRLYFLQPAV
jgi:hypothetical protein